MCYLDCRFLPLKVLGAAEQPGFGCSSEVGVWLVRGNGPFHRHLPSHQESLLLLSFPCPHGTRRDKGGVLKLLCWLSIPNLLYFAFQNSVLAALLRNLELVLARGGIIVNKFCCSHVAWEVCFWRKKKKSFLFQVLKNSILLQLPFFHFFIPVPTGIISFLCFYISSITLPSIILPSIFFLFNILLFSSLTSFPQFPSSSAMCSKWYF